MQLDKYGLDGVAVSIGLPRDVTEAGLDALVNDGCVQINGNTLLMPNFLEAQEAKQSDKARQAESRARRRDKAKLNESVTLRDGTSQNVTECHTVSHGVTDGHTVSHGVTPSRAVPCRAVPNKPLSANADRERLVLTPVDHQQPSPAQQVFAHWCAVMKKRGTAVFDAKRRRAVEARLKDGYSVADLCRAIDGCAITPHNIGQNDKGQRYDDLELICRDASHVDRFAANASQPPVPNQPEPKRHPEIWRKLKPGEDIYADPYGEDA